MLLITPNLQYKRQYWVDSNRVIKFPTGLWSASEKTICCLILKGLSSDRSCSSCMSPTCCKWLSIICIRRRHSGLWVLSTFWGWPPFQLGVPLHQRGISIDENQLAAAQPIQNWSPLVFFSTSPAPDPDQFSSNRQHISLAGVLNPGSWCLPRCWCHHENPRHCSPDSVSWHFDRSAAYGVHYHDIPCWLWSARWWSARLTTAARSWSLFPATFSANYSRFWTPPNDWFFWQENNSIAPSAPLATVVFMEQLRHTSRTVSVDRPYAFICHWHACSHTDELINTSNRVGMIYIDDIYPRYISDIYPIFNFENIRYFRYFHISATYLDKIA